MNKITQLTLNIAGIIFLSIICYESSLSQSIDKQFINGDALPDAPELSARGEFKIGVRTIEIVHKDQIDILKVKGSNEPLYDRKLKLEIWYPATLQAGKKDIILYKESRGIKDDPKKPFVEYSFSGRALRDGIPVSTKEPFPLIIVSHGYVGSRLLMSYLAENLASKGYIVVAIDHMESTYQDAAGFQSTLLNRAKDIHFVLEQITEMSKPSGKSFLSGLVDVNNTALIGYSMGGFGVLNVAGAGYSSQLVTFFASMTGGNKAIEVLSANNPDYNKSLDPRIKAIVAFAPWGMERGVWDVEGLKGLKIPTFFIAGSMDDISGYEKGIKAIYNGVVNADRYLLTYINARHNVAPNSPPDELLKTGLPFDYYYHYAEPAWDQKRLNNINQHFVTAFLGLNLKAKDYAKYLDLPENSNTKTWIGFKERTSVGMELLHAVPAN